MKDNFILLTTLENSPIIIGVSNISSIEMRINSDESPGTTITFNFARNSDLWPKTIDVKESFTQIKSLLGL